MLWNHDYRLAFCHIPRTGGTSLRLAFFDPDLPGRTLKWQTNGFKHTAWKELDSETQEQIKDYTIICFHRDPYDRMISMYQHWILRPLRSEYHRCKFEEWITSTQYGIYPRDHKLPQSHYCDGLPEHTIYIPFEELGSCWHYIRKHVPKSVQFSLNTKWNSSVEHVSRKLVLTPPAVQWINHHHAEDFDRFKYKKLDVRK